MQNPNDQNEPDNSFTDDDVIYRKFQGVSDFPRMLAIINGSKSTDGMDRTNTLENIKNNYAHLTNSDPDTDMIFADVRDMTVGYGRVWWYQVIDGPLMYGHFAFLLPEWRDRGLRKKMVGYNEQRIREIARFHEKRREKYYEAWATDSEKDWIRVLEEAGYSIARYSFEMVRPHLDEIPICKLPEGLTLHPVDSTQVETIWQAAIEAFRDHWNFSEDEWSLEVLKEWQDDPTYNPSLWKVAWDGDQVAGMVLNYVNANENIEYKRQRGYTETICVRRPWRRRGLAKALIAESLKLHKSLGMTETAHSVDAENPHGALHLYQSMGYRAEKTGMLYRKPLRDNES